MTSCSNGFTLLELLVVLVILGLGAAIAAPNLIKLVGSLDREALRDQATVYLQRLPTEVMEHGGTLTLHRTDGYVSASRALTGRASMAPGEHVASLEVWLPRSIEYRANGACSGGMIHWQTTDGDRFSFNLEAPLCQPGEVR